MDKDIIKDGMKHMKNTTFAIIDRIRKPEAAAVFAEEIRAMNKKIVFTNGCFDILHRGHVEYLEQARLHGDILWVGVNSDASVERLKGKQRPILPEEDRAFLVASLMMVDVVSVFEEDTPLTLIKFIQPDVLIKGGDYQIQEIVGREVVEGRGGDVLTIPLLPGRSTSNIVEKIVGLSQEVP